MGACLWLSLPVQAQSIGAAGFSPVNAASVTVNWTSGFAPGFTYFTVLSSGPLPNAFSGNQSSNTLNLFAAFAGLSANATYYARTSTDAAGPYTNLGSTSTLPAPPGQAVSTFSAVTTVDLTVSWSSGAAAGGYNRVGTTYTAQVSIFSDFSSILAQAQTTSTFLGANNNLNPDTTYYVRVTAMGGDGGSSAFTSLGSTSTLAVPPGSLVSTYSFVSVTGLTVAWASGTTSSLFNGPGTIYVVQISTMGSFNPVAASSQTANQSASFSGLTSGKTYFAQAQALNNGGGSTSFTSLGSTFTSSAAGIIPFGLSNVGSSSATLSWFGAFATGTTYYTIASTGSLPNSFSGNQSSNTYNQFAVVTGLTPNATYFMGVSTISIGPFVSLGAQAMLPVPPGPSIGTATFTAVTTVGLTVTWSSGTPATGYDVAGTTFEVRPSTMSTFVPLVGIGTTTNTYLVQNSGLNPNTTYYIEVAAYGVDGSLTAFTNLGSTSTLGVVPSTPTWTSTFTAVSVSGLTVNWSSGSAASYNGDGTRYSVEISTMSNFNPVWASSQTAFLSASFSGLTGGKAYYGQVKAFHNSGGATAFINLGSTVTTADAGISPGGFSSILSSGFRASWNSAFASGTTYYTQASSGAFPNSFTGNVSSNTLNLFADLGGLIPNTTYYARISTMAAGPFMSLGSTVTVAALPGPAPAFSTYSAVSAMGLTVTWTSGTAATGYNPVGTSYLLDVSTVAGFNPSWASATTTSTTFGTASGLTPDTTFYARISALSYDGGYSNYTNYGSTMTLAAAPGSPTDTSTYTAVLSSSFTVNWSSGTTAGGFNPAGVRYVCEIAAASNFNPVDVSSTTLNRGAQFTSLSGGTTYYVRVRALNEAGTPSAYANLGSTVTLPGAGLNPAGFSAVGSNSLTVGWNSTFSLGTTYYTDLSSGAFPNSFSGNVSSNTFNLFASFTGLQVDALYFTRTSTVSGAGPYTNLGSTYTLAVAPSAPAGSTYTAVSASGLTLNWSSGTPAGGYDPAGALYLAEISPTPGFTSGIVSSQTANLNAAFTGLSGNTTYYAHVQAFNAGGTGTAFTSFGSTLTPAAVPGLSAPAFSLVGTSSVAVSWTANGNAAGTTYYAQISTMASYNPILLSSSTYNLNATFAGLGPNATYYAQAAAFSVAAGTWTSFVNLQSTITAAAVPAAPAGSTFTAAASAGLTVNWSSGAPAGGYNPSGTLYRAQLSAVSDFSALTASSQTGNLFAAFTGLVPDTTYYVQIQAFNAALTASSFVNFGSTWTSPAAPAAPAGISTYTAIAAQGLTLNWSSGTAASGYNPAGTVYLAQISTMPSYAPVAFSSQTANLSADFAGLNVNATYYARAQAFSNDGNPTAFTGLGSTSTLASSLSGAAGSTFTAVFASSLTVGWYSGNPAGTVYVADLSTTATFAPILASSRTYNLAATFTGLSALSTYYARVSALNNNSVPTAYANLGSTQTIDGGILPAGFSAVTGTGATVAWTSIFGAGVTYFTKLSTGVFPNGFSGNMSSSTLNLFAAFTGLSPATLYYSQTSTDAAGPFTGLGSTMTMAVPPAAPSGASTFTAVFGTGLTLNWSSGTAAGRNPLNVTLYQAEISTMASFAPLSGSSQTYNLGASFSGLLPNTTYFVHALAYNAAGTPSAYADFGSTTTPASVPGVPALVFSPVAAQSLTVSWTSNGNAAGTTYYAQISNAASFSSVQASSRTFNLSANFAGLSPNATFYARAAAYDIGTGTWTAFTSLGSTSTLAAAPDASTSVSSFTAIGLAAFTLNWSSGTAAGGYDPSGTSYLAQISTMPDFSTLQASSQTLNLSADFSALSINTTYYAQVRALSAAGAATSFTSYGWTATSAVQPATPVGFSTYTSVLTAALTMHWSSGTPAGGYNPSGSRYQAQISTMPTFIPVYGSSNTANLLAIFGGLNPSTTYFAQVQTVSHAGVGTAFTSFASTCTLAVAPGAPAGSSFTAISTAGFVLNWSSGTAGGGYNSPGTAYLAQISSNSYLPPIIATTTYNLYADFSGLLAPHLLFQTRVQAINGNGVPTSFVNSGSTYTASAPPAAAPAAFAAVLSTGLTVNWNANGNAPVLTYLLRLSVDPGFATIDASSQTYNVNASLAGLGANTTYYAQAAAFDVPTSTWTSFTTLGSTSTTAAAPSGPVAVSTYNSVYASSFTVNWSSGTPAAGYNAAGTSYVAQVSTMATFLPVWSSSQTANLFATFTGLSSNSTYYAQVKAVGNAGDVTAFADLGSTLTAVAGTIQPGGFSNLSSTGLTVAWLSSFAPGLQYFTQLSTGAFPNAFTGNMSSNTFNSFASFAGLGPNATYYAQAATAAAGPFWALSFVQSYAAAPGAPIGIATFTAVYVSSLTLNWSSGTAAAGFNPAGTAYVAQLSTVPGFVPLWASSQTFNRSVAFTSLRGATTFYAQVQALNGAGTQTAFANLGSTATSSGPPGAVSPSFSAVTGGGFTVAWAGNSPPQTAFYAQISTMPGFVPILASSQTFNQYASFSGLGLNATFYAQATAFDVGSGTWTAFTALGSTSTLAGAPGQPVSTFTAVSGSALTLNWSSGTAAAGYDPAGTLYRADLGTDPGFAAVAASSQTFNLSAGFASLFGNTTYYARAEAINNSGTPTAYTGLGSTVTAVLPPGSLIGSSTFTGISLTVLTVNWSSGTPALGYDGPGTWYVAEISTMATFVPLTASSQTYNLSADFSALSSSTTYYAHVKAVGNDGTATAFADLGSTATLGGIVPGGFNPVWQSSLTAAWQSSFAPGTFYYAQLSSGPFPNSFSGNQSSNTFNLAAVFTGLVADSTYYAQVASAAAGPFFGLGSTATLAAPPGPAGGSAFSGITTGGLTLTWSSGTAGGYNPLGTTLYQAEISTAPGFAPTAASSRTYNLNAAFAGLGPGAVYYARVEAVNFRGIPSAYAGLGSASTLAVAPGAPAGSTFTAVAAGALTLNWSSGSAGGGYNDAATSYLAQLSTAANFATIAASSQTYNLSALLSGLNANTVYFARTQAVNNDGLGSAFTAYGSTATPAAPPAASSFAAVLYSSIAVNWLSNGNPAGTTYYAQVSTMASFSPILASSQTYNLSASFTGLSVNATYFFQAAAYSLNTGTWTAFTNLGATSTLANAPSAPSISQINVSSLTLSWSANGDPAGTIYVAQISTDSFGTLVFSSRTLNLSAAFSGLIGNATYFTEVQALNNNSVPTAFAVPSATWTAAAAPSSAAPTNVGASTSTANWLANGNAATTRYLAQISTDTFGTINASSSTTGLSADFYGLAANTTYYFRVQAAGNGGAATAFTTLPSTVTLLLPPAAAAVSFGAIGASSAAVLWAGGGNGAGTTFYVQLSTDNFATVNASSSTFNLSAVFGTGGLLPALSPNTTYFARVQTVGASNVSAFVPLGSTSTLAVVPGQPSGSTFTAVTGNGLTVSWSSGSAATGYNASVTLYRAQISTMSNFAPTAGSSQTYNLSASFAGLNPNSLYYAQVQAVSNSGFSTGFTGLGSTATPTAVPGASSFTAVAYTSVTVNWLANGNAAGTTYYAQISTMASFSPILLSSQTFNLSAAFTGLNVNATYFAQAAAYNLNAGTWTAFANVGATSTLANAPSAPSLGQVNVSSLSLTWNANGDPAGTTYLALISTDNFATLVSSSRTLNLSATFFGLVANATYYLEAQALNNNSLPTGFAVLPATWTAAAAPSSAAPTNVGTSSITANWSANGNAATTLYLAQISTDAFGTINASSATYNMSAAFTGLASNTTYYFRTQAVGNGGAGTAFTTLPSTMTLLVTPAPAAQSFSGVVSNAATVLWANGGNGPGTLYNAQVSTDGFASVSASSATYNLSALFGSPAGPALAPNTTYYARVQTVNGASASAFVALGSTNTLAVPPGVPSGSSFTAVGGNALTVNWSSGSAGTGYNGAGSLYLAQISTMAIFAPLAASSQTAGLSASFSGLNPNTVYYAQVQTLNNSGGSTAFTNLGSTAMPTAVPGSSAFTAVAYSSITVNWFSNGNAAGTTYYAQISTMAGFNPILLSSQTYNLSAVFTGLSVNTTYFAQAAAYNVNTTTWTAFTNLAATSTLANAPSSPALAQVNFSSISVTWTANGDPAWTTYLALISTDNFATTVVSSRTLTLSATFFGLASNATYYLEVEALNNNAVPTAFAVLPATWTAAAAPVSAAPTTVGSSSVTANWSANGNAAGTRYVAQVSTDAFATVSQSSATFNLAAAFTGLPANTTFFFRVQAVGNGGLATAFTNLPSTMTLLLPPAAAAASFGSVAAQGAAVLWAAGGNGPGTIYNAQISTDGFGSVYASSSTFNLSAVFGAGGLAPNLLPNTTYFARVQSVSGAVTSAFVALGSTSTLAVAPGGPAGSTFTAVSGSSLTVNWSSGSAAAGFNAAGTSYVVQLSTMATFAPVAASSQTLNLAASFFGLNTNTAYYAQVQAVNNNGVPTAFTNLGSTATPTAVPGAAPFTAVAYASITVNWASGGNPAGTTYYAQISTSAGLTPVLASSQTFGLAAVFTGLNPNTTYFAQTAAFSLNTSTWTAFTALGATSTLANAPSAPALGQVNVSSVSFSWSANGNPAWTFYQAVLSTDNFATTAASSRTLNVSASFLGLAANATYYLEVQAVGNSGAGTAFAVLPATWTAVAAPVSAPPANVGSSSVTIAWGSGGNAAGTLYSAQVSTDGFTSVNASSDTYGLTATFAGLSANTAYGFRVLAVGNAGLATPFTTLPSTTTLLLSPAAAAASFTGVAAASAALVWAAGGNGAGTTYYAQISTDAFATVNASSTTFSLTALFGAGGQGPSLRPNTTYYARVQTIGAGNVSAFLNLGSTITWAFAPTGTAVSGVTSSSATLSWSLGSNPAYTIAEVQQSTDGVAFAPIYAGAVATVGDGGLLGCTTYWVKVRNVNGGGLYTAFDSTVSFTTQGSTPSPAIGLSANAVTGSRVALSWTPSPSPGIASYRLFYDSGTGTVGYGTPLAVLTSTETSFTTGILPSTATYIFALRARNNCGVEETTGVFAQSGSTATLAAVRASVIGPGSGKRIAGTAVSVVAGLLSGTADQVGSIVFQFRATGTTSWANVVSADPSHPNPAAASPYFIHWDVTGFGAGGYDLRAVAVSISGSSDTAPSGISVVVDNTAAADIIENANSQKQTINSAVTNTISVAGSGTDNRVCKIVIPAGALTGSTVAVTVSTFSLPSSLPAGLSFSGSAVQITLSNGQHQLGGLTAPLTISYSGSVGNGTGLKIYTLDEATGLWSKDFESSVDLAARTVTGNTPHFSVFVVVNGGVVASDLDRVRVWPNPYKPTGASSDEGRPYSFNDPTSGIVFDQLPAQASLRIYTITGRLVAHFDTASSGGRIQWDARNDSGAEVASGVYIAVITSQGHKTAVRKVAIIR